MTSQVFNTGRGTGRRSTHVPPVAGPRMATRASRPQLPHYPFQPLPPPKDPAPYRYDISKFLSAADVKTIKDSGVMVCHTVGDTGDYRPGSQKDLVANLMKQDADNQPDGQKPAFFYHIGDIVYFAGDVDKYGDNFYATYEDYPAFIVAIPGNHDCQPDDPADGPVDPNKYPLDGFVQNFMSHDPGQLGSNKTSSSRTRMDLPNVYWTFTTPLATFIGLFSNVGETEGEIHQDQIDWFRGELRAADPNLALVVAVHHPPDSGDVEHTGSNAVAKVLFDSFAATSRYPNLILSGHVHNYQRFTRQMQGPKGQLQVPLVVAGAGGYKTLRPLQKINGQYPQTPLTIDSNLTLEAYDQTNFGFLRLEISKSQIVGTYLSAPAALPGGEPPTAQVADSFTVDLERNTVQTSSGAAARRTRGAKRAKKAGKAAKKAKAAKRSPTKRAKKARR
jgi:acid phosphatase type 7